MAWLQKLRQSQNYYVGVWLPNQKRKKLISTGTNNRKRAERVLSRIVEIEYFRKTEEKFIKSLYADLKYDKALLDDINEFQGIDVTITIEKATEMFLKSRGPQVKPATLQSYKQSQSDLGGAFGDGRRILDLKKVDYDRLLSNLMNNYVPTTVNIRLRSIRTFFNWCVEYEYLEKSPFKFKMLKIEQLPKFLMPEEITGIYKYVADEILYSVFKVYEATGIRLSELYTSEYQGDYLKVKGKGGKERFIPFRENLLSHYHIAIASNYSTDRISRAFTIAWRKYLISQNPKYLNGSDLNSLSEIKVRKLAFIILEMQYEKQIKKNILTEHEKRLAYASGKNFHCFRHTYAVRTWAETGDIYKVKKLLGHSTVGVTEKYTRFPIEYIKNIIEK